MDASEGAAARHRRRRAGAGDLAPRLGRGPGPFDPSLRPGLASFTPHFSEEVDVNVLTNDAWDPKSGTSEFKATAVRIEKLPAAVRASVPVAGE